MTFSIRALYQPTVLLSLALMAVIVMMVLPVPSYVLDIGLSASFGLAILIFTITLFIGRPLDFSAFPTILLATLMLRLSLNVSSTKLIIGEGHNGTAAAGKVIEGFAMFVMGGSVYLGLVVFGVLMIVNFIVITKGAGRMAEVGARFALDGMPGKQLAIDADMAAGAIDHAEAKARRQLEQEETTFFGSLDGASKFVKGDAVAGLLITLLNLVVGLAMGVLMHGMPIGTAFETYAILTVGDGLVTQIPAVIISIAAALLLSKGSNKGATDLALLAQLGRYPVALATVATIMALFALVPGLPFVPFVAGAIALGLAARSGFHRLRAEAAAESKTALADAPKAPRKTLGDMLDLDEIHLEFATNLVPTVMDAATGLDARILNMRNHIAASFGLIIPEIRLTDSTLLPDGTYVIRIQGVEVARSEIEVGQVLVLLAEAEVTPPPGRDVREPVYGAPARWIDPALQEDAALLGLSVVNPTEVVATHLLEVLKANFARLFNRRSLRKLLDEFVALSDPARAQANRRILDEMIPDKVSVDLLQSVLRLLLQEQVSIRNLPMILDSIAEAGAGTPEMICEHVRHRMGFQLVSTMQETDGALPLVQLASEWEPLFQKHQLETAAGGFDVALPPAEFNRLAAAIAAQISLAGEAGRYPAIVTTTRRRRFVQAVLSAKGIRNPVFSFEEVGANARPALLGVA
ncbi:MAG: flagellar biosynthesis protein FlhA [Paracoccaceae bacterium]